MAAPAALFQLCAMRLRAIIVVLAGLMCQAGAVHAVTLTGQILDSLSHSPVTSANVQTSGGSRRTISDTAGAFRIDGLDPGTYSLTVSHVAYREKRLTVAITSDSTQEIRIYLRSATIPSSDITVTATPVEEEIFTVPQSISITTQQEFAEKTPSTTADVLREETGILVQKSTHGHGAPIIRGLIGKYVLLLYDGIRLNKPTFRFGANQYLNTIDLESLAKIEVARGPSSVMYGSDAIGGAVNLIPAMPRESEPRIQPRVVSRYASADDSYGIHTDVGSRCGDLRTAGGITLKRTGDLRAGSDIGKQAPTGWDELDFNLRSEYQLNGNHRFSCDYVGVRQEAVPRYDKYVSGDFAQFVYDPQYRDLVALGYESSDPIAWLHSLKAKLSYQRDDEGRIEQRTGSDLIQHSRDKVTTWGGYLQGSSLATTNHLMSVGAEYYDDRIDSKRTESDGDVTAEVRPTYPDGSGYRSFGVFAQDRWTLPHDVTATLGIRYSRFSLETPLGEPFGDWSESYEDVTGSVRVSYKPDLAVNLVGGWSRGFRAPNLNDVAVLKYSSSGVDAPSPGLGPEHSHNLEIGTKVRTRNASGSFFLFYNRMSDLIDRKPGTYDGKTFFDENGNGIQDPGEFDIYQRRNVADARIYGFEYHSSIALGPQWETRATVAWTRGENLTDGEYLSRIPPLMGSLALRYEPKAHVWVEPIVRWADAQRHLSARDRDDTRIDPNGTPGWITFGLRGAITLRTVTLNISLINLTDTTYKEHGSGVYSPGRGVVVTLTFAGR
jgi:outer membrane receptor protein involved in Fe transport